MPSSVNCAGLSWVIVEEANANIKEIHLYNFSRQRNHTGFFELPSVRLSVFSVQA